MFLVDNKSVVHILNSRTSPEPNIMHLLRSLLKAAACFSFTFAAIDNAMFWAACLLAFFSAVC